MDAPGRPAKAGDKFAAGLTITISPGWHISSLTQPDGGPVRTTIEIPKGQDYRLAGPIKSPEPHKEHSATFDMDVETYTVTVVFTLPLIATEDIKPGTKLTVEITYQACSDETCLLPKTEKVTCIIGDVALQREDGRSKGAAPEQSEGVTDAGALRAQKEQPKPAQKGKEGNPPEKKP